jgi:hypothetical protein
MKYYNQVDDYHRRKAAEVMDQWLGVTPKSYAEGDHKDSSDDMGVASA